MKNSIKNITTCLFLFFVFAILLPNAGFCATPSAPAAVQTSAINYELVNPLDLVAQPKIFINKNIKIVAQFDKFSVIGLDYPPVNKSSKDYISFMIKRPDVLDKGYTIPLSELKLIIKRTSAEKLVDLESGDKVAIKGKVISSALNDPWIEVAEVISLETKQTKDKK